MAKLRQIEVLMGQGKTVSQAAKEAGITDQTFYRWQKEYGGLQIEQAKKFKDLQRENAQLRRAVAAQATILIHELAHLLQIPGFDSDFGDEDLVSKNDRAVDQHCGKLIGGLM